MKRFLAFRLLQGLPVLIGLSLIAFGLMHLAPGGPGSIYAENPYIGSDEIERLERSLGLHDPLHIQYVKWVRGLVSGDWGHSYRNGTPVTEVVSSRVFATAQLMIVSLTLAICIGVAVGTLAALRPYSIFDQLATSVSLLALSIPSFWFGLVAIYIFSVQLGWLPSGGISSPGADFSVLDRLRHIVAPAAVMGLIMSATWARYTRSTLRNVLEQDYLRTARAKGLPEFRVITHHAFRNALLPLITLAGLQLPQVFSGALVIETVFSWPGMGRLFFDSLSTRDYPVMMAILMLVGGLVFIGNLLADLGYALGDPRIRYE